MVAVFTFRQRQILDLRLNGYGRKEIAQRLGIGISAVESHLQNMKAMTDTGGHSSDVRLVI